MVVISEAFSPLPSLLGGLTLGVIATARFMIWGKITGISGIASGTLKPQAEDFPLNVAFVAGLILGGLIMKGAHPPSFESMDGIGLPRLVIAGLMVGFGTQLGNGCTSGHGICGNARLSPRSMVATLVFMGFGCLTTIMTGTVQVAAHPTRPGDHPWYILEFPLPILAGCATMGGFITMILSISLQAKVGAVRYAMELLMGFFFAMGLTISGMLRPSKVAGFLDFTGAWDPSLAFVMGGALLISAPLFTATVRNGPAFPQAGWGKFKAGVDARLVAGAALFGVGWGYAGACPGPALVNLGTLQPAPAVFVGAMWAGFILHSLLPTAPAPASSSAAKQA